MFVTLLKVLPPTLYQWNILVNSVKSFAMVLVFMLPTVYAQQQAQPEIRKIVPLKLAPDNLGQKIICYRPTRHGIPKKAFYGIDASTAKK